jgi:hypothetical protein
VGSTLSKKTGSFLFHIQLLLAISTGMAVIELDNYTDDPSRAAEGIYSLLDIDTRKIKTGYNKSEFAGKDIADQLNMSEGQMRMIIDTNTYDKWVINFKKIATKINTIGSPWEYNVKENIDSFIRKLSQFSLSAHGLKKSSSKRKSKRK